MDLAIPIKFLDFTFIHHVGPKPQMGRHFNWTGLACLNLGPHREPTHLPRQRRHRLRLVCLYGATLSLFFTFLLRYEGGETDLTVVLERSLPRRHPPPFDRQARRYYRLDPVLCLNLAVRLASVTVNSRTIASSLGKSLLRV